MNSASLHGSYSSGVIGTMDQEYQAVSRREFVKGTGAMVGGAAATTALGWGLVSSAAESNDIKVPQVVLGRTGAKVSRLGIGCSWFQRKHVSPEDVRKVLCHALELNVNYLDVAPNYGNEDERARYEATRDYLLYMYEWIFKRLEKYKPYIIIDNNEMEAYAT